MIDMISQLFKGYDYKATQVEGAKLFSQMDNPRREEYWLVIDQITPEVALDNQATLFSAAKEISGDTAFDKNTSMLLLWETTGEISYSELKRKILSIEADSYFFKKYVLYYSKAQMTQLQNTLGDRSTKTFVEEHLA